MALKRRIKLNASKPKKPAVPVMPVEITPDMDVTMIPVEKRASMYREVRDKRLALFHEMEEMKGLENRLNESLLDDIEVGSGFVHEGYAFTVKSKEKPVLDDWSKYLPWVFKTGRTDTLQKRIAEKAIMDTEDWHKIPGVKRIFVKTLSVTKR